MGWIDAILGDDFYDDVAGHTPGCPCIHQQPTLAGADGLKRLADYKAWCKHFGILTEIVE